MNRSTWIAALAGIGLFLIIAAALGLLYVYSGSYNVAATNDLEALERWVFSTTATESIRAHAEPLDPPLQVTEAMVQSGARSYQEMCVMCHGAPGVEPAWLAEGMKPEPPEMSHAVEHFSDDELYWILQHGIKHSGMPAMAPTHGDEAIRSVVAFIKQMPEMSPQEYQQVAKPDSAQAGGGSGHMHGPGEQHGSSGE